MGGRYNVQDSTGLFPPWRFAPAPSCPFLVFALRLSKLIANHDVRLAVLAYQIAVRGCGWRVHYESATARIGASQIVTGISNKYSNVQADCGDLPRTRLY